MFVFSKIYYKNGFYLFIKSRSIWFYFSQMKWDSNKRLSISNSFINCSRQQHEGHCCRLWLDFLIKFSFHLNPEGNISNRLYWKYNVKIIHRLKSNGGSIDCHLSRWLNITKRFSSIQKTKGYELFSFVSCY